MTNQEKAAKRKRRQLAEGFFAGGIVVAIAGVACLDWRVALILSGVLFAGLGYKGMIANAD